MSVSRRCAAIHRAPPVAEWLGMSEGEGKRCETCYGVGEVPTDEGLVTCPDCGGSGTLASPATLVEWRLRAIERAHDGRNDETAMDLRWLAFEVRRARDALTELVSLIADLDDSPVRSRMLLTANGALHLYQPSSRKPAAPET
jgi:hypothetical protein